MGTKEREAELWEDVRLARTECVAIEEQHERLVQHAHGAPQGSPEMLQALRCATDLGPHVSMALRRYLDALEILTAFCEQIYPAKGKPRNGACRPSPLSRRRRAECLQTNISASCVALTAPHDSGYKH